jgi:hypothetical protein
MGPRVYIFGARIHHGLFGCLLVGAGALMVIHDWKDRPWPLRDR